MCPTGHLDGRRAASFDGIAAAQRVVDDVSVGLNVAGEAAEHLAHGGARVLGLKLEKELHFIGQNDNKVSLSARLTPAVWEWLRADRDAGGVSRKAEGRRHSCERRRRRPTG
jgi:hypothetical protein